MLDVSAFGAQLELERALTLPGKFVLLLSNDGRLRRQCLVIWRTQNTVGVEFNPPFPTKLNLRLQAI
jgi:PilZ domain